MTKNRDQIIQHFHSRLAALPPLWRVVVAGRLLTEVISEISPTKEAALAQVTLATTAMRATFEMWNEFDSDDFDPAAAQAAAVELAARPEVDAACSVIFEAMSH